MGTAMAGRFLRIRPHSRVSYRIFAGAGDFQDFAGCKKNGESSCLATRPVPSKWSGKLTRLATSYLVFACHLRSNRPLPGVMNQSPRELAPGRIAARNKTLSGERSFVRKGRADLCSSSLSEGGDPGLQCLARGKGGFCELPMPMGRQFWLDNKRETLWTTWRRPRHSRNFHLFARPILGLLLRLRGITCLHASAVSLEGRCRRIP